LNQKPDTHTQWTGKRERNNRTERERRKNNEGRTEWRKMDGNEKKKIKQTFRQTDRQTHWVQSEQNSSLLASSEPDALPYLQMYMCTVNFNNLSKA
jgi:hypothetical protein